MSKVSPSLYCADSSRLNDQIQILEQAGAECFHIDMMDAVYVPSLAFSIPEVQSVKQATNLPLDIHIMMVDPERVARKVIELGAYSVNIHYEANNDVISVLELIKSLGAKAGVVLNPETSVEVLTDDILRVADAVQLMSVPPGECTKQAFIYETLQRIRQVKSKITATGSDTLIQVDGDINFDNVKSVLEAGADMVVVGAALFHGDLLDNIKRFKYMLGDSTQEIKRVGAQH